MKNQNKYLVFIEDLKRKMLKNFKINTQKAVRKKANEGILGNAIKKEMIQYQIKSEISITGGGGNSSLVAHENIHENTWKEDFEYSLEFVERYRILLKLLPQAKKYKKIESVLDIGCGKQFLRDVLNEQHIPIQKYIGVDLYQHKKDTIICDLNNESLPNMGNFDLVVCAGVLEYIYDVKGLLKQIFGLEPFYFLCSYNFSNLNRTHNPIWVKNMMTQKEILDYCIEAGYNLFAYESDENKETLQTGYFLFTHKNVWQ